MHARKGREKKTCTGGERTINKIYLIIHKK
jgi:hypothetical protein